MGRRGTTSVKTGYKKVGNAGIYEPKIVPPATIKFINDDSIVKYDHYIPKNEHRKKDVYVYVYFQASERCGKLGTQLPLTEEELLNLIEKDYTVITYAKDDSKGDRK